MTLPPASTVLARLRAELPAIRRWGTRGVWAVMDQAMFAGTNFLVNVLLARWLEPAEYGAFAVASSVLALAVTLHGALWTEPMLVYGPGRLRGQLASYRRVLHAEHWRFTLPAGLLCVPVGLWFVLSSAPELGWAFVGLAAAVPTVPFLWLTRRAAYVELDPRGAALCSGAYLILCLTLLATLAEMGHLWAGTALTAMGITALLGTAVLRPVLRPVSLAPLATKEVRTLHWRYGRWALGTGALLWLQANFWYIAIAAFHGVEATAYYRALLNLLLPIMQLNVAMSPVLTSYVALLIRKAEGRSIPHAPIALTASLGMLYGILIVALGAPVSRLMYGNLYTPDTLALGALAAIAGCATAISALASVLKARQKPERVAAVYGAGLAFSLAIGCPLVYLGGVTDALVAQALSAAVMASLMYGFTRRPTQLGPSPME